MSTKDNLVSPMVYSDEDHETWSKLVARQNDLVQGRACKLFLEGYPRLQLDPARLPDPQVVSQRLRELTGWTLGDAQNEYLGPTEWFEHLNERRFPVTNYIRRPHELEFTPLPDLFHEYYGHLGFFTDQYFADTSQMFGHLYLSARTEEQQLGVARLWWFSTEFGLIHEDGELKIYGAGLLSSSGELVHALKPETPKHAFDIKRVAATASAPYGYHEAYFVIDGYDHLRQIVLDYAKQEGLPAPRPPAH
jgi:phenylalanine-4-hydroxylase